MASEAAVFVCSAFTRRDKEIFCVNYIRPATVACNFSKVNASLYTPLTSKLLRNETLSGKGLPKHV